MLRLETCVTIFHLPNLILTRVMLHFKRNSSKLLKMQSQEVYGKTTFLNGMSDTMNFPPNMKKRSPWREAVASKPLY